MRVEQRIGRIDRLGQKADKVLFGTFFMQIQLTPGFTSVFMISLSFATGPWAI